MPVNMGRKKIGPGFGCSCRSFRLGEPTPEQALAALARSANVTVEDSGSFFPWTRNFEAWTEPENRYAVTFDEKKPGGWCKHCIAAMVEFMPWHRQLALGASDALDRIHELEKENRKLQRKIDRLEAKNE